MHFPLFVYGTLRPGQSNEYVLSPLNGIFIPATIKAKLYPDGWLPSFPYPGVDLEQPVEDVSGFIFDAPGLASFWGRLDAFEGTNYQRVTTNAIRHDGGKVEVYVYAIVRD